MTALVRALEFCARHGKWGLVLGLIGGLALPGLATAMRPWLPQMVAGLLFITAFRIGYRASVGQLTALPRVLAEVLTLQLALPLVAFAVVGAFGLNGTTAALAVVLMMAAPSISGSPNFAILMGHDPAPAMQVLVLGTALFPLTIIPILLLLTPELGEFGRVLTAGVNLITVIAIATGAGFALRAVALPAPNASQLRCLDGLGVIALAVIVVGLMAGIRPVLEQSALVLAGWVALVFAANFGLQVVAYAVTGKTSPPARQVPLSIIAGNRNVALFLVAFPAEVTDQLLVFIGCYQLPMYLTPLLMRLVFVQRTAQ
jgi:ACR3 family arsenite transporter